MAQTYCPGCALRLALRNSGCPTCGYQCTDQPNGRIPSLWQLIAPSRDTLPLNDVCPAFLNLLARAAQGVPFPILE